MTVLNDLSVADRYRAVAADFTRLLAGVADWEAPTPVQEWDVREIVRHLVDWLPGLLAAGSPIQLAAVPGVDDDPVAAWRQLDEQVQVVLDDPGTAGTSYRSQMFGEMTVATLIDQFWTPDVFMHSWDLARATGQQANLEPRYAAGLHRGMARMGPALRESGQFGEQQPVPDDADEVDELVAFIGRDPRWRPSADPQHDR